MAAAWTTTLSSDSRQRSTRSFAPHMSRNTIWLPLWRRSDPMA
eukprot:CAMPEP_0118993726 /NCGR_PEP_ID=MMETSP1173-20130426/55600_1 /TAXON_ID=1034831 /ORGANISM="Rhizochromulina marina cf, Strain CCMP1243" /LENGTH=42 /DNA_ID= /DNA_START= /DNA_END= /DNA_ORIENTATION=